MILYNIKLSIRSIKNDRIFVVLNTLGFSIGLAVFMVISLFVYNELSVDTEYPDHRQLYRVLENNDNAGIDYNLSDVLSNTFPEIEKACPVYQSSEYEFTLETKNKQFITKSFISTQNNFFELFGINAINATSQSILPTDNSMALTKSTAFKLFGDGEALGQQVKFMNRMLTVSAVIPEFSKNSSLHADFIINIQNKRNRFHRSRINETMVNLHNHYVFLADGTNVESLAQKVNQDLSSHLSTVSNITFQPIQLVYLSSNTKLSGNRKGSKKTIFMFITIAIIILLLSMINYIQFSISYHFSNIKNIGLKMFNGASKRHIYQYYLIDTAIFLTIVLILAFILMRIFIPSLNPLFSGALEVQNTAQWPFISVMIFISIIIVSLGGYLPLFVISKTDIKYMLSKTISKKRKPFLKGMLPIIQFTSAIILLISTLTIQKQLTFVKETELGFAKHNLLQLSKPYSFKKDEILKQKILELSCVENVSWSYGAPAFIQEFFENPEADGNDIYGIGVDENFLKTFDITLINGRNFMISDLQKGCYVNETFLKSKNWTKPDDYLNQKFFNYKILGVVNDFYCNSLHEAIQPTILYYSNTDLSTLNIKLSEGDVSQQLSQIKAVWKELLPDNFFNYKFYDNVFDNMYKREEKLGKAISLFSLIAFFITAMGLLGLVIHFSILRTKEIGIRKVNGAKVSEILTMLNKDFIKWVAIAFVIAVPIAYYAMSKWLENFAYKTTLSWWIFALAGVLALGIALLTVSWQSWRAASRNPVEALRYE